MNVEVTVRVDGREVAELNAQVTVTEALPMDEPLERLQNRVGGVLMEGGGRPLATQVHLVDCQWRSRDRGQ